MFCSCPFDFYSSIPFVWKNSKNQLLLEVVKKMKRCYASRLCDLMSVMSGICVVSIIQHLWYKATSIWANAFALTHIILIHSWSSDRSIMCLPIMGNWNKSVIACSLVSVDHVHASVLSLLLYVNWHSTWTVTLVNAWCENQSWTVSCWWNLMVQVLKTLVCLLLTLNMTIETLSTILYNVIEVRYVHKRNFKFSQQW